MPAPDRKQLVRQAKQHLDSLRRAGVKWLPAAPPGSEPPAPPRAEMPAPVVAAASAATAATTTSMSEQPAPTAGGASAGLTPDQRRQELQVLKDRVTPCARCAELASTRTQTVFGVGPVDVELCFIGEAPGQDEDQRGEPFVGPAGQLLDRIIGACGMKREEVYICNIIKCRPPGNRQPLPNEAANCREYLERQLELVRPKFICALGATAAQNLLGTTQSIGRLRGGFQQYQGIPVLCTYHPAYLLRSPEKKKDVWEDMKRLLERMGRPVPKS